MINETMNEFETEDTSESEVVYTMKFGKHKGKTLDELDPQYLNFLLTQEWFNQKDIINKHVINNDLSLVLNFGKFKGRSSHELIKDNKGYLDYLVTKNIIGSSWVR